MLPLPPFVAKLIASDEYEEKKYFETKAAAEKWVLGEGKEKFDGDVERAEIHHVTDGLIWSKHHLKVEDDIRYKQMRNPGSHLWYSGIPRPKSKPSVSSYCPTCAENDVLARNRRTVRVCVSRFQAPPTVQSMLQGRAR